MHAKTEIRYAFERVEVSGPVIVRMRDGQWLSRPENYERYEKPISIAPPPPKREIRPDPVGTRKGPRERTVKPKKTSGAGQGWRRMHHVTVEAIVQMQVERGLTDAQIAAELGCDRCLIVKRLRKAEQEDPQYRELAQRLRTCDCGKPKLAREKACSLCKKRQGKVSTSQEGR
jgi:hypothetical protein